MHIRRWPVAVLLFLLFDPSTTSAQAIEMAGPRAPGMGGAFVAVASDGSATWWNPAGLAAGPFVDLSLGQNRVKAGGDRSHAWKGRLSSFALGTPPVGISYYAFRLADITAQGSTAMTGGDRQGTRTGVALRSVPASQFGVTLVHSLISGIHVGSTLKYVRGRVLTATGDGSSEDLLAQADGLRGSDSDSTFDLDIGALGVFGPLRAGGVIRNVREARLGGGSGINLPRQVRLGVAFDGDSARLVPLTIALDADVRRYDGPAGERRVIALGAEQWFAQHRVGFRAGARFNTVGAEEHAVTAGGSVAVRAGLYLDTHAVFGRSDDERGWGVAARVSF
jgi:hypothetical protein